MDYNGIDLENGLYNIGELVETDIQDVWVYLEKKSSKDCIIKISKKNKDLIDSIDNEDEKVCSECEKVMTEGYCIENGLEYYCSDECLKKHMTMEEYEKLYDNGNGDSYWTDWN